MVSLVCAIHTKCLSTDHVSVQILFIFFLHWVVRSEEVKFLAGLNFAKVCSKVCKEMDSLSWDHFIWVRADYLGGGMENIKKKEYINGKAQKRKRKGTSCSSDLFFFCEGYIPVCWKKYFIIYHVNWLEHILGLLFLWERKFWLSLLQDWSR